MSECVVPDNRIVCVYLHWHYSTLYQCIILYICYASYFLRFVCVAVVVFVFICIVNVWVCTTEHSRTLGACRRRYAFNSSTLSYFCYSFWTNKIFKVLFICVFFISDENMRFCAARINFAAIEDVYWKERSF